MVETITEVRGVAGLDPGRGAGRLEPRMHLRTKVNNGDPKDTRARARRARGTYHGPKFPQLRKLTHHTNHTYTALTPNTHTQTGYRPRTHTSTVKHG